MTCIRKEEEVGYCKLEIAIRPFYSWNTIGVHVSVN